MARIGRRYAWRYILRDGSSFSGTVWAFNKSDAAALAAAAFAANCPDDQRRRGAWCYGVERVR